MAENSPRTADLERRTSALEAADHLAHSLDENTDALNGVKRRYRLSMSLIALVVITLLLQVKFNYDGNVNQCQDGNAIRDEIDAKWNAITQFLDDANVDDDAEGVAFLALIGQDLPRRDCSSINWLGD